MDGGAPGARVHRSPGVLRLRLRLRLRRRAVGGQAIASTVPPRVRVTRPLDSFVGPDVPVLRGPPPSPSSTIGHENGQRVNAINNENFTENNDVYLNMEVVGVDPSYTEIDDSQPPEQTTTL